MKSTHLVPCILFFRSIRWWNTFYSRRFPLHWRSWFWVQRLCQAGRRTSTNIPGPGMFTDSGYSWRNQMEECLQELGRNSCRAAFKNHSVGLRCNLYKCPVVFSFSGLYLGKSWILPREQALFWHWASFGWEVPHGLQPHVQHYGYTWRCWHNHVEKSFI